MYIKSEVIAELIDLIKQLLSEANNHKVMYRGHKYSKDNGYSWYKSNRVDVLQRALDNLNPPQNNNTPEDDSTYATSEDEQP